MKHYLEHKLSLLHTILCVQARNISKTFLEKLQAFSVVPKQNFHLACSRKWITTPQKELELLITVFPIINFVTFTTINSIDLKVKLLKHPHKRTVFVVYVLYEIRLNCETTCFSLFNFFSSTVLCHINFHLRYLQVKSSSNLFTLYYHLLVLTNTELLAGQSP